MRKIDRQRIIRRILQENAIYRQEDLVAILQDKGIEVTQATISGDVKDMQLLKVPTPNGEYRYSVPPSVKTSTEKKLNRILKEAYVSSDFLRDMCVFKVLPGNGPVITSLITQMAYDEVFAAMGDDDTVMLFAKSDEDAQKIHHKLLDMIGEE